MTTLREAAQQALWALEMLAQPTKTNSETPRYKAHKAAITALRAALAQETQTPCDIAEDGVCEVIDCCRNSPQILEALEIGYDSAQAEAAQYHAAMAGYRPERHAAMDADVQKIAAAITAVKAALAQEDVAQNLQSRLDAAKLLEERRQEISQPPEALRHAQELDEPKGGGNLPPPLAGRAGAAAQREKLAHWMRSMGYATGHGDTIEDLLDHLGTQISEGLEVEVLMEREACAKECDAVSASADKAAVDGQYLIIRNGAEARRCAAAIRARSKT